MSSNEEMLTKSFSQNQDKLLARIKQLKEERDSLLTALRLLRKDSEDIKNNQNEKVDKWQKVEDKKREQKNNYAKHGSYTTVHANSKEQNVSKQNVVIVGDSITKNNIGPKLSTNHVVKSFSLPGATIVWLVVNKLSLNVLKPEFIIIGSRQRMASLEGNVDLSVGGYSLKRVQETKFLGVHIDENLTRSEHVEFHKKLSVISVFSGK